MQNKHNINTYFLFQYNTIYTHTSNQTQSLISQTKSIQPIKQIATTCT
jgi:hypothetical protein